MFIIRKLPLLLVIYLWLVPSGNGQSIIFKEDFNALADGSTAGPSWIAEPPGKCDASNNYDFNVESGQFLIRNVEGQNCNCPSATSGDNNNKITFGPIDISEYCDVSVSLAVFPGSGLECADGGTNPPIYCPALVSEAGRDMFYVEVLIDGKAQEMLYYCGNILVSGSTILTDLNGSALEIHITSGAQATNEQYAFDDVEILGVRTNQEITIISDQPDPICEGSAITLIAQSSGPWLWNTGQTSQSITVIPPSGITNYQVTESNGCAVNFGNIPIIVLLNPIASAGSDQIICLGQTTTLYATGGTEYAWSTGEITSSIIVSPSDDVTYSVTVTENGCSAIDQVKVSVNPLPVAYAGEDQEICLGETVTLKGSGGESYIWSTGSTSSETEVTPTETTTYSLTVTSDGCSSTDEVRIATKSIPIAEIIAPNEVCQGEILKLEAIGGTSYFWNTGDNSPTIYVTPTSSDTYSVTVTQNDCSSSTSQTVTLNELPKAYAGEDQVICKGERAELMASGGTEYLWSTGETSPTIMVSPTIDSTYRVTVSQNGCSSEDEVNVFVTPLPIADAGEDQEICLGETAYLEGSGGDDYRWSTGAISQKIAIAPTVSTAYNLTVTSDGCSSVDQVMVYTKALPDATISGNLNNCKGTSTILSAQPNESYMWSNGSTLGQISISPNRTSTYGLTVTDNGCSASNKAQVIVHELPYFEIDGDKEICAGETSQLKGSDLELAYLWSTNETTSSIAVSPLTTTSYSVKASDEFCSSTKNITVDVHDNPIPYIVGSPNFCPGSTTTLFTQLDNPEILWSTGETTDSIEVGTEGPIFVTVTDFNNCVGTSSIQIIKDDELRPVILGDSILCQGDSSSLLADQIYDHYMWSDGSLSKAIDITQPGTYGLHVENNDGCSGDTTFVVVESKNPTVSIEGDTSVCIGDTAKLKIPPFPQILWSDGSTADSTIVAENGLVYVAVSDVNGCTAADSIIVNFNQLPEVMLDGHRDYCQGDSTQISVLGDFAQINWSDGNATPVRYFKNPGTFGLKATNVSGCSSESLITIIELAQPQSSIIGVDTLCKGTAEIYRLSGSFISSMWHDGSQIDSILVAQGGNISVQITDSFGCQNVVKKEVIELQPPRVDFKPNLSVCNYPAADLFPEPYLLALDTVFQGSSTTGVWSFPESLQLNTDSTKINFIDVQPGIYKSIFTTTSSIAPCSDQIFPLFIDVKECRCPEIRFQKLDTLCNEDDVLYLYDMQLSALAGSWQVTSSPTNILPQFDGEILDARLLVPGTYELEFQLAPGVAPSGCVQSKTTPLTIAAHVVADLEILQPACSGEDAKIQLSLSGASTYDVLIQKSNGDTIELKSITDGTTFFHEVDEADTLSFIDVKGNIPTCGFTSKETWYPINAHSISGSIIQLRDYNGYGTSCHDKADGALQIQMTSGRPPFNYVWNNQQDTAIIEHLSPDTYIIIAEDSIGCQFIDSLEIIAPNPMVSEWQVNDPVCHDESGSLIINNLNDDVSDTWEVILNGQINIVDQFPHIFERLENGEHHLEIINANDCSESSQFVMLSPKPPMIGLEENIKVRLGQEVMLSPSFNFVPTDIRWSPSTFLDCSNCPSVTAIPLRSIDYKISATDQNGCLVSDSISIMVNKDRELFFPTGFSPNRDGYNDDLIIFGAAELTVIEHLIVFDRWGEEIFEAKEEQLNLPIDWDWSYRGEPLPTGAYSYLITLRYIDNVRRSINGSFQIVR